MIGLLLVVGCCTLGLAVEVFRLCQSYWLEGKRANRLHHEARRADRTLEQAREIHQLAPSGETRLLVALAEAYCDFTAAVIAKDQAEMVAFHGQIEMLEALLMLRRAQPVEAQSGAREITEDFRQAQLAKAAWQ